MKNIALLCVVFALSSLAEAQRVTRVVSGSELSMAVAKAQAGDTISIPVGRFELGEIVVRAKGEIGRLIVICAEKRNKSELIGDSRFVLEGAAHVVIEGFVFSSNTGPAITLRGCSHVRVTRNIFHLRESKRSSWVMIDGSKEHPEVMSGRNTIDHNLFEQKKHLGNFITIEGSRKPAFQVSQYDTIAHNHFRDIGPRAENVLEAIRIGSSDFSLSSGHTVMEKNLFERCDGDPEYVSIKSSNNVIRFNTFRECLGSLSLRHGNRNRIEGNFIFGNNRTGSFTDSTGRRWTLGTGGVRFYGDSMVIINNYFEGLTGSRWDATLAITNGDAEYGDGQPLTKHFRIRDALIAFNSFVNNRSHIEIGYDGEGFQGNWWRKPPIGLTIANNLIVGSSDTLIKMFDEPENADWKANIAYARRDAVVAKDSIVGVTVRNPMLVRKGMFRLQKISPAVDAAVAMDVENDIEGQPRGEQQDIGADELSSAPITNRPLTASDVGPDAR